MIAADKIFTEPPHEWGDLPKRLAADLARSGCEPSWRSEKSPQLSYGRHDGPAPPQARQAAVAILLCRDGDDWVIPMTVRQPQLRRHGGQVSFPGGLVDAGETTFQAAQRELDEELGYNGPIQWIGAMAPLWVFASNAWVVPCVGTIAHCPQWRLGIAEVASVVQLSCLRLLSGAGWNEMTIQKNDWTFRAPCLEVDGVRIWGATAVVLGELAGRLCRTYEQKSKRQVNEASV